MSSRPREKCVAGGEPCACYSARTNHTTGAGNFSGVGACYSAKTGSRDLAGTCAIVRAVTNVASDACASAREGSIFWVCTEDQFWCLNLICCL